MTDPMNIIFNTKEPVVFEKQLFGNPDIGWTDKDTHKYVVAVPNGSAYYLNGETIPLTSQNTSEVFGDAQIRIKMPATASTCSEAGCMEHYAGSDGNTYVLEEDGWKEVTKDEITIPTLPHTYDAPAWTVNTDGSMTASFACTVCKETKTVTIPADQMQSLMGMSESVTETWNWASDYSTTSLTLSDFPAQALTVIQDENLRNEVAANGFTMQAGVTSTEVAPTSTTRGQKIYTAAVMFNKEEYTDTKTKIISSTSRIVPEDWYASLGGFEEMAWRDFKDKHSEDERVFYADVKQTDETTVVCSIMEWQGKSEPLDVYTIDVRTGIGTNQAGEEINLPQTGVISWNTAGLIVGAFVLVSAGLWLTIIAVRKKESGEMPSVGQVSSI